MKPTQHQIDEYSLLNPLFDSLLREIKELSKKKPDEKLNVFKGNTINKVLARVKDLLINETTDEFLEIIDIDTLPSNSDVVFIMVQFETALKKFYYKHTTGENWTINREWDIEDDE
ncbi:hypothetical protein [Chryseobacterium sp. AG363]|uniref:hypothetical protein n=1 Tax=Chryseobacterium sp. AG363 TaxID=2183997 RepID=UPI000E722BF3|nr:hypothetical protein [Chryseobacterium sp. AG363]RKE80590.1 hypothetical protein DEU39_0102 [Chryseobacterium sp. AG363]